MQNETLQKPHWVEARKAVRDHARVIGYSVWQATDASGRYGRHVKTFRITATRSADIALFLANTLRDDLNNGIE